MHRFTGLLGIVFILLVAFLFSNNHRRINYRVIASGLAIQTGLAVFILKFPPGQQLFAFFGQGITKVLSFSDKGADFVFGALVNTSITTKVFGASYSVIFFFKIMPTIIFVSVLVSIAYHFGIMQRLIALIARAVYWVMGVSGSEALSNVASAFVGQVEAQIMIKPYLQGMTSSELLASMAGSMACIAGGVMAVYISFGVPASYLLAASLMAAPGALVIAKIVYPETEDSETKGKVELKVTKSEVNLLDAISKGATTGLKVALNVIAMLIGFIALIALVDYLLSWAGKFGVWCGISPGLLGIDWRNLNLKQILGSLFAAVAWLMGVPAKDVRSAGSLMGTKMVVNEFVAYLDLRTIRNSLDPKTIIVTSFALCGFANFSSIAIQIGGIGELAPERRGDLARLGLKALLCGTLASYLSATIAGILMP